MSKENSERKLPFSLLAAVSTPFSPMFKEVLMKTKAIVLKVRAFPFTPPHFCFPFRNLHISPARV